MIKKCFFDYYSITTSVPRETLAAYIQSDFIGQHSTPEPSTARFGYERAFRFVMADLTILCTVMEGGETQKGRTLIFASGESSERLYRMLQRLDLKEVKVTRVDVALDFDEPHAWEALHKLGHHLHLNLGSKLRYIGPSLGEIGETEDGRTLYVGARTSACMARIYEKGKKDDPTRPDWVRLELEFKPQNANAAEKLYYLSPSEIFTTHRIGRLCADLLSSKKGMPLSLSRIKGPTDDERAFSFMLDQYSKTMARLVQAAGGDYSQLVEKILQKIQTVDI